MFIIFAKYLKVNLDILCIFYIYIIASYLLQIGPIREFKKMNQPRLQTHELHSLKIRYHRIAYVEILLVPLYSVLKRNTLSFSVHFFQIYRSPENNRECNAQGKC